MKLQFTNGYRPRFDQISRIMQFLISQKAVNRIPRQDIVTSLGISDRQVENLTSMMTGFGLVLPKRTTLTPFGTAVVQFDPYFEKTETLWLMHYYVSSNPEYVVWYRIINTILPSQEEFSVDEITDKYFSDLSSLFSRRTFVEKLPKEVGAVFAAYTRSEFSHLGLLLEENIGKFLKSSPIPIPGLAFLFCLLLFRDKQSPGSSALTNKVICESENSPGKVFHLSEDQVRVHLENLHDAGLVRLERLANLDQVRLLDSIAKEKVLRQIFGGQDAV